MRQVITTERVPIKMWLDDIEDGALKQAKNLANLPFVFKHIAIMPDSHQGYGMPIGGVMATKGVVVPNAVGVDIGCGMCTVKTNLTSINNDSVRFVIERIKKYIPVGFNKHKVSQSMEFEESINMDIPEICMVEHYNASKSLGTLGGGNHFIEVQKGSDGFVWIMIHFGSRNLG